MSRIKKGETFGKIAAISDGYIVGSNEKCMFECECGDRKELFVSNVIRTNQKSFRCKCFKQKANMRTHGKSGSRVYNSYRNMIARCYNPKSERYPNYGARGIRVCKSWLDSFANFYSDMGDPPSSNHTLGRKCNDSNYCPSNCEWETQEEQDYNKQNTIKFFIEGEEMTVLSASKKFSIDPERLRQRIRSGMDPVKAVKNERHDIKVIESMGIRLNVTEWMKATKIPISSYYHHKRKGLDDSEVIERYAKINGIDLSKI